MKHVERKRGDRFWMRFIPALGLLFFGALWLPLLAGSASPFPIRIAQPDGTQFHARIRGDEHQGWVETEAGFTVVRRESDGFWEYAKKGSGGGLHASGRRVSTAMPSESEFPRHLKPERMLKQSIWTAKPRGKKAIWSPAPISGVRPLLVVLVSFADRSLQTTPQDWERIVFDREAGAKSVASFYDDNSMGLLNIQAVPHGQAGSPAGIVSVSLQMNHPNYGNGSQFDNIQQQHNAELSWINAALQEAGQQVDFAALDGNGDGLLSLTEFNVYFVLAGYDASISSKTPNIWAHAWGSFRRGDVTAGGKDVSVWAVEGELNHADAQLPMGVLAHELGHSICGLPDLYDISNTNSGMGIFSLMANGSHGSVPGDAHAATTPAAMDAWCRYYLGWTNPRTPQDGEEISFPSALSAADTPVMLKGDNPTAAEYFLIENRSPTTWDAGMGVALNRATPSLSDGLNQYQAGSFLLGPTGAAEGIAIPCGLGKPGEFPAEVNGQIALIQRGEITFRNKVLNARDAGAVGAIIYNNQPGLLNGGTLGTADNYIPVVGVSDTDGPLLAGLRVFLEIKGYQWSGGLLVIHVDENAGPRINHFEENERQGVITVEAQTAAGSLLDGSSVGHVTHLFYKGNHNAFSDRTFPTSTLYDGQTARLGLGNISAPGAVMTASFHAKPPLRQVVPWVVNNQQWLSRLAFYNHDLATEFPRLVAVTSTGQQQSVDLPPIAPGGVLALDSDALFPELSGYSLFLEGFQNIYPSFLTYNLDAPSGRSPAQTTGLSADRLSPELVFGYFSIADEGEAALVLTAPGKTDPAVTPVALSLFGAAGGVLDTQVVQLTGNRPLAILLKDLFPSLPEESTVKAAAQDGTPLAGTTFVFNGNLEPAMSLPFGKEAEPALTTVIPWVVNNENWLSRMAWFNPSPAPETIQLTAVTREGVIRPHFLEVGGESLLTISAADLFPDLSGYSLYMESIASRIYPSFLTFNLGAASGRSPAQTTASAFADLTSELVFGYLQTTEGGVSAIVLTAPEREDDQTTTVQLSLHDDQDRILGLTTLVLTGRRPHAALLGDLFNGEIPENTAVVASASDGTRLAGTTFVFNGSGEPSMSVPFSGPPF